MFEDVIGLLEKEERRYKQRERRRELNRSRVLTLDDVHEDILTAEGRKAKRRIEKPKRQWLLEDEL
jgi:hypothetical protein